MEDQNKNLILAVVLSLIVIVVWSLFFAPEPPVTTDADPTAIATDVTPPAASTVAPTASVTTPEEPRDLEEVLAEGERIAVETPSLTGSILLRGGRIDDLELVKYRETVDADSPPVRLLSPVGGAASYYAIYGWSPSNGLATDMVPSTTSEWTVESGETLTPNNPVTLAWDNGAGLIFRRTLSVDDSYMFRISQSVENTGAAPASLAAYGIVARRGLSNTRSFYIAHEGLVQMSDGTLNLITYKKMPDMDADTVIGGVSDTTQVEANGYIGLADKYWMTTLIPDPGQAFRSTARYNPASEVYQTETVAPTLTVAPGETVTVESRLYAGAKEWETLRDYQDSLGIQGLIETIDWGWFFFFTKPIFWLLHHLHALIGNMGWSIIALTIVIKALVLPLAFKSYVSMAKMRELQPEMEALKERAGEDKAALQKGMMELYKTNKVNPASGCLPILIQIPIFFSLYKVIFNTIELRQTPWIGWIRDLSAPDPSSILNLFGLLPIAPPEPGSALAIVSLGILPILLGLSMWLQQKLNPAPTDATQKAIFSWMPWIFMFMLGGFASGLVLYWITNNTITFTQQYAIMRSHGHKPDLLGNIRSTFRRNGASGDK